MSVNGKQNTQILFQKKNHQLKKHSSKLVNNVKSNKVQGIEGKSNHPLKVIDENDKNERNIKKKLEIKKVDEKEEAEFISSKDDSSVKENQTEKNSKETKVTSFEMNDPNKTLETFTQNAKDKTINPKQMSLNLENYLLNISLSQIKIPTDEYREMLTKFIRDEYSNSILNYLLSEEEEIEGYLSHHKITERMRIRMIDWMIEVLSNYHCDETTYFESVNLMDRYFKVCGEKKKILQPSELHIIGVTSMFIASKYQDIYPLRMRVIYEKIAHRKLTCDEIRSKEEEITKFLNYSIGKPNMWDFINIFIEEIFFVDSNNHYITNKTLLEKYYGEKDGSMAKELEMILNKLYTKNMINLLMHVCIYLAKMNCHDYNLMQKKPSLLAASTIFVAVKICEQINKEDYINDYFASKLNEISQKEETVIIKTAQKILANAQNFDTLFMGLENLKKVHFNAITEIKNTK